MMPGSCFHAVQVEDGRGVAARSRRTMSRCLDRLSASSSNTLYRSKIAVTGLTCGFR